MRTSLLPAILLAGMAIGLLGACAGRPGVTTGGAAPATEVPSTAPGATGGGGQPAAPIAFINGQVVTLETLRAPLLEAAGGQALLETLVDRMLEQRLAERGISLHPGDIDAERQRLVEAFGAASADDAAAVLREIRRRRGLGDQRFQDLLRRNAAMRRLVQEQIDVSPAAIEQAYQIQYGPQYRARILVVPSPQEASRLRRQIEEAPGAADAAFAERAVRHSTDPSAVQGGLLAPISPADPTVPRALRDALVALDRQGQALSAPVAVDAGYALIRLERKVTPDEVELADVKEELAAQVQRSAERVMMQQLVRELVSQAKVVVLDPVLAESWRQQRATLAPAPASGSAPSPGSAPGPAR